MGEGDAGIDVIEGTEVIFAGLPALGGVDHKNRGLVVLHELPTEQALLKGIIEDHAVIGEHYWDEFEHVVRLATTYKTTEEELDALVDLL